MSFVNLHVHTEWSLLDGMCRIKKLVPHIAELGQNAVGITDHGNMSGVIEFYKACKDYVDPITKEPRPIKPVIGMEAYVVPDMVEHIRLKEEIESSKNARKRMTEKQKKEDKSILSIKEAFVRLATEDERYFGNSEVISTIGEDGNTSISYKFSYSHLILFAKNMEGYRNLIQIATESQLKGFYTKPRIDPAFLKEHGKGIIATSACRGGEIPKLILRGRTDLAEKKIREYCEIFDEFYLEIQPGQSPEQRIVNAALIELSEKMGVPLVATSDAHYIKAEDAEYHNVLLSIQTDDKFSFDEQVYYIWTEQEMLDAGMPQVALDNAQAIADKCDIEFAFGEMLLPKIDIPDGYTSGTYISKLCYDSLYKYIKKMNFIDADIEIRKKRLEYELNVIIDKGLADYLLIVQDFLNWGRQHDVLIGPGRGSAVGSLACFLLGITTLDPIDHDLLFERFLNPYRPSFPDIDSDFSEYITIDGDSDLAEIFKSGRQTVLEYVISKYGADCICQIGTFGTMGTRSVLKDVARALSSGKKDGDEGYIDHNEVNTLNKFVPSESGKQWTLSECLYGNPEKDRLPVAEIVEYAKKEPKLFEASLRLEGMPRHPSIHAAGVVLCPQPVKDLIPLMRGGEGEVVAQFEMGILDELGLLKVDFLGLRTLGAISRTLNLIEKRHGVKIEMDDIPLDDPLAMKLIASGDTDGVFQIESDGMKAMFKSMNKVTFEDIVAGISLYRPGPMASIPKYVACLNGHQRPQYLFPELEPILRSTHGILVYQEQVMMIAKNIAGFDWIEVDGYRKAIGKKKEKLIKEMNKWLVYGHHEGEMNIPGLIANGIPEEKALKLADDLVSFGAYCFNKSHAAGYGKLVVITAYLKAHYPIEYMTPLISSYIGKDDDKITQYISEARRMGIKILPPDANKSEFEFAIEGDAIRFGLGAIKGLSKTAITLVEERTKNGEFKDLNDLLSRFGKKELNKKSLDVLCLSGALDALSGISQTEEISVIDAYNNLATGVTTRLVLLQTVYTSRNYGTTEGVLDIYCDSATLESMHKNYSKALKDGTAEQMAFLSAEQTLLGMYLSSHPLEGKAKPTPWSALTHGSRFDVIGIIRNVHRITTKTGKPMAFLTIETLEGNKELTMFTKEYEANQNKLDTGGIRIFTLESQMRDAKYSYIVKNVKYYRGQSQADEVSPY